MYPCQNGATCNNLDGSYECICAEGWTGVNCQIGKLTFIIPPANCVCGWVYCFHVVLLSVCVSVTFCFLNILKNH